MENSKTYRILVPGPVQCCQFSCARKLENGLFGNRCERTTEANENYLNIQDVPRVGLRSVSWFGPKN